MNQVAQGIRPFAEISEALEGLSDASQREWLGDLIFAVGQAHPTSRQIEEAIAGAAIRRTYTPCVLVLRKPLREALHKIQGLPVQERCKSFHLLTAILGVADSQRRLACGACCGHWWHRDLRDENVVNQILAEGAA